MQNFCVGVLRWSRPSTPEFRVGDTNMLVSKNAKKSKICVTPNMKPKRKSVKYRLCWVPNTKFSRWPCTFHVFVLMSLAFGGQCKPSIQWNMGLRISQGCANSLKHGFIISKATDSNDIKIIIRVSFYRCHEI